MRLFSGTAPAAGSVFNVPNHGDRTFAPVQSSAGTSGTFVIQGRMGADQDWQDLATLTDSAADTVAIFPQMRCNATAASGTCVVDLWANGTEV